MQMALERVPAVLLRLEGLVVLIGGVVAYLDADYSFLVLALLFFTPDVSFLGYLEGPRAGAVVYNVVHTYIGPIVLGVIGLVADVGVAVQIALIWLAHIGMDRALGFGLKYPTAFEDTHLQRV
jgi:hypothetical protein